MADLLLDTWPLSADEAVAAIGALEATDEQLRAILEHEQARKRHPRRQVIDALAARLGAGTSDPTPPSSDAELAPPPEPAETAAGETPDPLESPASGDVVIVKLKGVEHEAIVSHREVGLVATLKDERGTVVFARPDEWYRP